jgi:hypothetical protein
LTTVEQIDQFCIVTLEPDDLVEVRIIHGRTGESRTMMYCMANELAFHAEEMIDRNVAGWNIYGGLNPRKIRARGDENILLARCLFADRDHAGTRSFHEVVASVAMPPPTMLINSGNGQHAYWKLDTPIDPRHWREWQKDVAALLGTDLKVCNPERLVRLPGFNNVKAKPIPCYIIETNPSRTYDLADLPIPMRAGSNTAAPIFTVRRRDEAPDAGDRVERCRAYLSKCPNAVTGAGGHDTTYAAAATCNRFGLTHAEAIGVMAWFNSAKCNPPWNEKEIEHKVADAYAKNAAEHGDKLRGDRQCHPVFTTQRKRGAA